VSYWRPTPHLQMGKLSPSEKPRIPQHEGRRLRTCANQSSQGRGLLVPLAVWGGDGQGEQVQVQTQTGHPETPKVTPSPVSVHATAGFARERDGPSLDLSCDTDPAQGPGCRMGQGWGQAGEVPPRGPRSAPARSRPCAFPASSPRAERVRVVSCRVTSQSGGGAALTRSRTP
jgi:hypothetical protein